MERGRDREGLVRPGEIPAVLPRAPRRSGARHAGGDPLRRSGFLISPDSVRYPKRGEGKPAEVKAAFIADCQRAGFDVVGVTDPGAIPQAAPRLAAFLREGHHATMAWLKDEATRRADPKALWPEAGSVVMVGLNYGPDADPREALAARDRAAISVYARHRDYHELIKGRLKVLAGRFKAKTGSEVK